MKRKCLLVLLVFLLPALLGGCSKKNVFAQKTIPLIVSIDFEIEGVVSSHIETSYDENGMPVSYVSQAQVVGEEAPQIQSATFSYDAKERCISTSGLSQYQISEGTWETQPVQYWFDAAGRLLKSENPQETCTYTYDQEGQMTGSVGYFSDSEATTAYAFDETGLKELHRTISAASLEIEGSYAHNARGDLTYIHEAFVFDQPEYKDHFERSLSCSYDTKGRLIAQTNQTRDAEGNQTQETLKFTYAGDSQDIAQVDFQEAGRTIRFEYRYEDGLLREITSREQDTVTTESYTYDEEGSLIQKEIQGGGYHEVIKFEQRIVKDPVIASFLRMKTEYLVGSDSTYSLFVLQADQDAYQEHYCYMCGRTLAFPCQTCPYCGTKVNCTVSSGGISELLPPAVGMGSLWTVDGELLH